MIVGMLGRYTHALMACVKAQHRVSLSQQLEDDGFFTRWGVLHNFSPGRPESGSASIIPKLLCKHSNSPLVGRQANRTGRSVAKLATRGELRVPWAQGRVCRCDTTAASGTLIFI